MWISLRAASVRCRCTGSKGRLTPGGAYEKTHTHTHIHAKRLPLSCRATEAYDECKSIECFAAFDIRWACLQQQLAGMSSYHICLPVPEPKINIVKSGSVPTILSDLHLYMPWPHPPPSPSECPRCAWLVFSRVAGVLFVLFWPRFAPAPYHWS